MVSKNADNLFKIFTYLIWLFLFFVGVFDLFFSPYRSIIWFGSLFVLLFFYFKFDHIPKYAHFLLGLIAVLNVFGELFFEWYYVSRGCSGVYCTSQYYDKILHFFNPIPICVFVYFLSKPRIKDKYVLILFSAFATISLSVGWEIVEYAFDNFFGAFMQGVYQVQGDHFFGAGLIIDRNTDTILDLSLNVGGVIFFILFNILYNKREDLRFEWKRPRRDSNSGHHRSPTLKEF